MPYTNCVSLDLAIKELDLFDNIKFKYLKYLFTKDIDLEEWDFEVDIENIEEEKISLSFLVQGFKNWISFLISKKKFILLGTVSILFFTILASETFIVWVIVV